MKIKILSLSVITLWLSACSNGPKEINPVDSSNSQEVLKNSSIFGSGSKSENENTDKANVKTVTVKEVLPTEKYVYLLVDEKGTEYWIATRKREVSVGERYFFTNGLLKTNFESKEYNRIFDRIYLVNNIVPIKHGEETHDHDHAESKTAEKITVDTPISKEGSVKIADIVADPEKYANQTINVSGKCTKVNANIMGRNWIHLDDGSKSDYDFVATSESSVPLGHIVTLKGVITLKKDFGAGYSYDIIMENCQIVK